ncbi:MAG: RluA family pseudouridine synthase [Salinisphaera sp.]|jgi:23S rRNA pseudouridine955/2504/2580 synthase|nr:RluA family pseudouridine synthase [Salinisphaera sp.]
MRLDNFLLRLFKNVPKSRIYKIIRSGEVRINKGRAKPATRLAEADEVRLPPVHQKISAEPGRPPDGLVDRVLRAICDETPDYLMFAKPAGLAVHAGTGLRFGLIEVLRAARPNEYFELVHRLDRNTSGCLLVARSRKALDGLRAGLNDSAATKRYLALLEGRWNHGQLKIDLPLSRDQERAGERVVTVDRENGRPSQSLFTPLEYFDDATLMEVEIQTGRTHQIRVHAANAGHPVAADDKYGPNARMAIWKQRGLGRMFLHAASIRLAFGDRALHLETSLPADLAQLLSSMKAST